MGEVGMMSRAATAVWLKLHPGVDSAIWATNGVWDTAMWIKP